MFTENCYYASSVYEFKKKLKFNSSVLMDALEQGNDKIYTHEVEKQQKTAWLDELKVLCPYIDSLDDNWAIIMEYILPRAGGRRPDIIILTGEDVFILEFKQYEESEEAQFDQLAGYRRDLRLYHSYFVKNAPKIHSLLVLTKKSEEEYRAKDEKREIFEVSPATLAKGFFYYQKKYSWSCSDEQLLSFLQGDYQPLPDLVEAVKLGYEHKKIPEFEIAKSAGIPKSIDTIQEIARASIAAQKNSLIILSGVPGAGKTMAGISLIMKSIENGKMDAAMITGNQNLVDTVNYTVSKRLGLPDSSFLFHKVHDFLVSYGFGKKAIPYENLIVFDEAQRIWDKEKAAQIRVSKMSEPAELIEIGKRKKSFVIVALFGDGQQINDGEEGGMRVWESALQDAGMSWDVYCAPSCLSRFSDRFRNRIILDGSLDLDKSLRSQSALVFPDWLSQVLEGNANKAKQIMDENHFQREYPVYISRNAISCKQYMIARYKNTTKKYGLLHSSQIVNKTSLESIGIPKGYKDKDLKVGPWFCDPPESEESCCQLNRYASEFKTQGLELDFACMIWDGDFCRKDYRWQKPELSNDRRFSDPLEIRKNAYRVLLSRARDGVIIYIPKVRELDETYEYLLACGCEELKDIVDEPHKGEFQFY